MRVSLTRLRLRLFRLRLVRAAASCPASGGARKLDSVEKKSGPSSFLASAAIIASLAVAGVAAQSGGKPSAASATNPACALLTREIVTKYSATPNPRLLDLIPPEGEPIGPKGSACEYGGIRLQIDPFANPNSFRKSPPKDWQVVSGVGDLAYFHNNLNNYAELMVFAGSRLFTIQMSLPMGGNAEAFKSNTVALANVLIPKLR